MIIILNNYYSYKYYYYNNTIFCVINCNSTIYISILIYNVKFYNNVKIISMQL